MRPKSNPVRVHQVCSLLQHALGDVFLVDVPSVFNNVLITVTAVYLGADFGTAKVYLSFSMEGDKDKILEKVVRQKSTIKRMLGLRIASKVRKVPELRFYADNSVNNATRVHQLIDALEFPGEGR